MCESPDNSLERQTAGDLRVFEHIFPVIVINELVANGLAEDQPGNCGKENTDAEDYPTIVQSSGPVSRLQREGSAAMSRCGRP